MAGIVKSSYCSNTGASPWVARAIRHMHSLGIACDSIFDGADVYINSNLEAQFDFKYCMSLHYLQQTPTAYIACPGKYQCSYEWEVFSFGCLFYEILFDIDIPVQERRDTRFVPSRPSEPEIDDNTWRLIRWCCARSPVDRPTIDEVVEEMQSWK